MLEIFRTLVDFKQFKFHHDDDTADRLNRQYSSILLIVLATVVSARQYLGEAIHCWCPEQCASNHETYANVWCWIDDTYYVPFLDQMPQSEEGKDRKITYYQWVPIILMLQAIMFCFPRLLWKLMSGRSGINISTIIEAAETSQTSTTSETREKNLRYVVHLLDRYLEAHHFHSSVYSCCGLRRRTPRQSSAFHRVLCCSGGWSLSLSYLVVKTVYLANAVGQLFLLNVFLGYEYHSFGVQVIAHLFAGNAWTGSDRFPHVTLCDFRIRQNTNVHKYTVQCVLPINIFNEKVFVIVWFWLVIVALVTFVSLAQWTIAVVCTSNQTASIRDQITGLLPDVDRVESAGLRSFVRRYLQRNGLFVLRLIERNAGHLVAAEVVCGLWINYGPRRNREQERTLMTSERSPRAKGTDNGRLSMVGVVVEEI